MGFLLCAVSGLAQTPITLVDLANSSWRYHDSGQDLSATNWQARVFPSETNWPAGLPLFGVESSSPYPYPLAVRTPVVLGAGRVTYYFRTHFTVAQDPAQLLLTATAYLDDGAVIYLNGTEVARVRMPAGAVTAATRASSIAFPEGLASQLNLSSASLVQGDNVLAVEVHQNSDTTSDAAFAMSLQATAATLPSITTPGEPASRTNAQGVATTLTIAADGLPTPALQWYKNGSPLPGETGNSLNLIGSPTENGDYFVVVSNFVGSVTSRTAVVFFIADNTPPQLLFAKGNGEDLFTITVAFSEPPDDIVASDNFIWEVVSALDDSVIFVAFADLSDGTNVTLITENPRNVGESYFLRTSGDIPDLFGNLLLAGAVLPVALFDTPFLIDNNFTQAWRYEVTGANLGTAWTNAAFDDSSWSNGFAVLDGILTAPDAMPLNCRTELPNNFEAVRTCLTLSNELNTAQLPSVYFRTRFQFQGNPAHSLLRLTMLVDDAAVFYLNGAELLRPGMPSGPITRSTFADRTVGNPHFETFEVLALGLIEGENVLAVEVHQDSLTSPDLTFGLRLQGIVPALPPP